jgi:predicted enzyme related to lactoylglutathione lyase
MPLAHAADGWAQLDTGAAQLALGRVAPGDAEGETLAGRFVGVSLAVADVDAAHTRLRRRGVDFVAPPERMPWGGVLAHFRDPEGNVLTLLGTAPAA